ncbi:LysR family transcriptional regulator [Streptomyces filipinensis]|uniref:LysR family transcriptional regulator n=1 Tax=Streptomyces filipinensis TaxID=66887 RepID=A0A918IEM4_9ACTN|nr:LysR family transcriptional regulator [Streptomyces filipinensis]GGV03422.1 LysR family transcriptional regulator [Streptomyces filipinensis]
MDLEVRHLRVICAIAEAGSLTRAAASLRMTQPGLSAQLRRIEAMLGGAIFDRGQAGAVPTALGELVLPRARAILPGIDGLLSDTVRAARCGTTPGRIRLGSAGAPLLTELIVATRELIPGAEVTTRCRRSPSPLLDDLAAGRLEAAVLGDNPGHELPPREAVVLCPVATEPVFALLPSAHPLAAGDEVRLEELIGEDWALPHPDGDRTREYWSSVFSRTGRQPHAPYEAEGQQLIDVVRAGLAVSLCQATFTEVPGVAVRPLFRSPLWYRHVLGWRRDGPLAAHGDVVVRRVAEGYLAACAAAPAYARWRRRHPELPRLSGRAGGLTAW